MLILTKLQTQDKAHQTASGSQAELSDMLAGNSSTANRNGKQDKLTRLLMHVAQPVLATGVAAANLR
jgi:hypothetical protein